MSHSVKVTLIGNQEIVLFGDIVNIYDLKTIELGLNGEITAYTTAEDVNADEIENPVLKVTYDRPNVHDAIREVIDREGWGVHIPKDARILKATFTFNGTKYVCE